MNKILNKVSPLVILIFLLTFIFGLSSCKKEEDSYRNIKIVELEGDATIKRKEKEYDAYINMSLRSNDNISVCDDSSLILKLDSDKYLYVGENSNIDLVSSEKDSTKTIIRVNEGSIVSEVKNKLKDDEEYGVETPNSVMAIRGTTFGVRVSHGEDGYCEIDYKLIKGKIEIAILDQGDSGYNAGVFNINPMQELSIIVDNDALIEGNDLLNVIDSYNKNEIAITNYEDADDYVSTSNKVSLFKSSLYVENIQEELKTLPTNHDDNVNRVVALESVFEVVDKRIAEEFVYEQEGTYRIILSVVGDHPDMVFAGWLVNDQNVGGNEDRFELEITKSCVVRPIFVDYDRYHNVDFSKDCMYDMAPNNPSLNIDVEVNGEILESSQNTIYDYFFDIKTDLNNDTTNEKYNAFVGYFLIGDNSEELLSTNLDFEYSPDDDVTISIRYLSVILDNDTGNAEIIRVNAGQAAQNSIIYSISKGADFNNFDFSIDSITIPSDALRYEITDQTGNVINKEDITINGTYYITYYLLGDSKVRSQRLSIEVTE